MSNKDVQDYLEKGMYGTPEIKPEEKKIYLGTFRERIFLTMTLQEMKNEANVRHLQAEIKKYPHQQVLINAAVDFQIQSKYMSAIQQCPCTFTIVDTENQQQSETIGLVYTGEKAIDFDVVSVSEKYPLLQKKEDSHKIEVRENTEKKKESLFSRLFNKGGV